MDISRPAPDETVDYYHRYIALVPDGDIRLILHSQHDEMLSFLGSIPETMASHRYAPEKWSVAEVLCHINDCERVYLMRAFWFARGLESAMPSFEPELAVKNARPAERTLASHVREFALIRAATADFFRNLPAEAWLCRGVASGYPFTVRALAYIAAGHVFHHAKILRDEYLRGA